MKKLLVTVLMFCFVPVCFAADEVTYSALTADNVVTEVGEVEIRQTIQLELLDTLTLERLDTELYVLQDRINDLTDRRTELQAIRAKVEIEAKKVILKEK